MDAAKIGALIAQQRRKKNLSQSDLAHLLGVTNKAVSRWETGRGYPDIETLPELAKCLDVTIVDLLNGEISKSADTTEPKNESLADFCAYAGEQRKKQTKVIIWLCAAWLVLVLGVVVAAIASQWPHFYNSVIGSDVCVVAADYSALTYLGGTYLPLPMCGYECRIGEQMISEAQVEGVGFWEKLLFGEAVFEVKNVPCDEIVYLQTDYDELVSEYFVLEERYDYYADLLRLSFDDYYIVAETELGHMWERPLVGSVVEAILAPQEETEITYGRGLFVYAYEENHIFFRRCGEVSRYEGAYYWMPYEYVDSGYVHAGFYMTHRHYRLNEACYDALDMYFELAGFDEEG